MSGIILGRVSNQAVEKIAHEVIQAYIEAKPREWAAWKLRQKLRKETLLNEKGFSRERELMFLSSLPLWIELMMGRRLGDPHWADNDQDAYATVLKALPEARINQTSGVKQSVGR
jgi:hypothetical protein